MVQHDSLRKFQFRDILCSILRRAGWRASVRLFLQQDTHMLGQHLEAREKDGSLFFGKDGHPSFIARQCVRIELPVELLTGRRQGEKKGTLVGRIFSFFQQALFQQLGCQTAGIAFLQICPGVSRLKAQRSGSSYHNENSNFHHAQAELAAIAHSDKALRKRCELVQPIRGKLLEALLRFRMTDTRAMSAGVLFDVATAIFATGFVHDLGIDECCKSLKDLALKETPVTIVLRASVELKLTTRKTVETVKSRGAAHGRCGGWILLTQSWLRRNENKSTHRRDREYAKKNASFRPSTRRGASWKPGPIHRGGWGWPEQGKEYIRVY